MKQENAKRHRIRTIAAVFAVIAVAGSTAGALALRSRADNQPERTESAAPVSTAKADTDTISAGGTVSCEQLSDSLGLINTNVRLTVEAVLAESGDSITAGTALYQITEDSLAKAEKTLQSELQSAENTLIEKRVSCQQEQNSADVLYESELLLGQTAQQDYTSALAELDSSLQQAYDEYMDALNTIGNTPAQITAKQSELDAMQANADTLQAQSDAEKEALNDAESAYSAAAEKYNSTVAEYNAAAGVVRYLGKALGMDISGITLAQTVSAAVQTQTTSDPSAQTDTPAFSGGFDADGSTGGFSPGSGFSAPIMQKTASRTEEIGEAAQESDDTLTAMYREALAEYEAQKKLLTDAETAYRDAENRYQECDAALADSGSALKDAQSSITALEQEISTLNSTLSKAKSSLSKLRSEYNSRKASYDTDKLSLQHTLDTDTAAYENAEYHHEITSATIEDELAQAQSAYDTAEENLRIFEDTLSDGYVYAHQDGILYSLSTQEGRSINLNAPFAYYVDETSYYTVVELDQNNVTEISIGDTVLIYSSETGTTNGKVTAIAEGTANSLADVRFNVTISADENAGLYSGESVNVYFNAGNLKSTDFRDFEGGDESGGSERTRPESGSGMPDFSGEMPAGFDPSNLPGFGSRKGE